MRHFVRCFHTWSPISWTLTIGQMWSGWLRSHNCVRVAQGYDKIYDLPFWFPFCLSFHPSSHCVTTSTAWGGTGHLNREDWLFMPIEPYMMGFVHRLWWGISDICAKWLKKSIKPMLRYLVWVLFETVSLVDKQPWEVFLDSLDFQKGEFRHLYD